MILCAIGGDDTYRIAPYLFEGDRLYDAVHDCGGKIFLGFSDTTLNHLMLHRAGLSTFYGQAFLPDICELGSEIPPYTRKYFEELITTGGISEIRPSELWYECRTDFDEAQIGTPLRAHVNTGFELLQGSPVFEGEILGGCIDSIYDIFNGERYSDMPELCAKYGLLPTREQWRGKILLLESSEELMPPDKYRRALEYIKAAGIFESVSGIICGKPQDGIYQEEYKRLLVETVQNKELPIVCNLSVGHALPRCIIPFGVPALVDTQRQLIRFSK